MSSDNSKKQDEIKKGEVQAKLDLEIKKINEQRERQKRQDDAVNRGRGSIQRPDEED